jgi:hypothetical protein
MLVMVGGVVSAAWRVRAVSKRLQYSTIFPSVNFMKKYFLLVNPTA